MQQCTLCPHAIGERCLASVCLCLQTREWRRGTTQLWLAAPDGTEVAFLLDGPTVERLPLDETGQGCG